MFALPASLYGNRPCQDCTGMVKAIPPDFAKSFDGFNEAHITPLQHALADVISFLLCYLITFFMRIDIKNFVDHDSVGEGQNLLKEKADHD